MPNPVDFLEIDGPDGPALQQFYTMVLGWRVDTSRVPGYGYLDAGDPGALPGGIRQEAAAPAERVLYIKAPDLAQALERVKPGGGVTVRSRAGSARGDRRRAVTGPCPSGRGGPHSAACPSGPSTSPT
jgi:predicted enzyme related to lactoylglutathione lyase